MPLTSVREFRRAGLPLAVAVGFVFGLASSSARAGDDGAAPIWVGVGSLFGLVKDGDNDAAIDYREHGRLVLPPKIDLPPPGGGAAQSSAAWPVDPDVQKRKKAKEEEKKIKVEHVNGRPSPPRPNGDTVVTINSVVGGPCAKPAADGSCPEDMNANKFSWNPLTWVGLQKSGPTVLGPEPDRDWLTDPPKGFRAPVEGVGAVADSK